MKLGSLFSGAGLGDLGWIMAGFDIKWQVEVDDYCRKILDLRFPETKKYGDIKTIKGAELEPVDIITGGFPCQPFSVAGLQKAEADDRNLWPKMLQIISEIRPRWIVGENVPGVEKYLCAEIIPSLENEGYWNCKDKFGRKQIAPFIIPSSSFGAEHRRDRVWIVAHSDCGLLQGFIPKYKEDDGKNSKSSNSICSFFTKSQFKQFGDYRGIRKIDGATNTMDRLKCLGNGQVPAATHFIGRKILEFERVTGEIKNGNNVL